MRTRIIAEWAEIAGINYGTGRKRKEPIIRNRPKQRRTPVEEVQRHTNRAEQCLGVCNKAVTYEILQDVTDYLHYNSNFNYITL